MSDLLLEIQDLHLAFDLYRRSLNVLDGVAIAVSEGEKVGIVGETGCGKSITMKAAMGILPIPPARIAQGQIQFNGRNLLTLTKKEMRDVRRREMSFVPQDPSASLNPVLRVGTQLIDVIRYSGNIQKPLSKREARRRAINILREVGLPDPQRNMRSYPIQLSGGMQQRVLISMALATGAILLIADEPSTALDVTIQDQILRLMRELVERRGVSIVIITHNLGVVRELTDRTCVMYAGQVVENVRTKRFFAEEVGSMHPYTQGLMESIPRMTGEGVTAGIRGMIPDYADPPSGCRFRPRCDHAMPICETRPPAFHVEEDHNIACHLYKG